MRNLLRVTLCLLSFTSQTMLVGGQGHDAVAQGVGPSTTTANVVPTANNGAQVAQAVAAPINVPPVTAGSNMPQATVATSSTSATSSAAPVIGVLASEQRPQTVVAIPANAPAATTTPAAASTASVAQPTAATAPPVVKPVTAVTKPVTAAAIAPVPVRTATPTTAPVATANKASIIQSNKTNVTSAPAVIAAPAAAAQQPASTPAPITKPVSQPVVSTKPASVSLPMQAPADVSIPQEPSAPVRQSEMEEHENAPVEEGFDTTSLTEPSGNWWYKRIWWERAEERYTRIQQEIKQILEMRAPIFAKRTEAEQKIFEPLFTSTELSQGELTIILADLINELNVLKAKQHDTLTDEQKEFLATLQTHQKTLEDLHEDIQKIALIDNELDETLNLLLDIIDKCNGYEREAWEQFRAIAKELSDSRARELYYHIVTLEKTIDDNVKFIANTLTPHFEQLLKMAQEQADRITSSIQSLKEKGLDFKKHAEQMEQAAQTSANEQAESVVSEEPEAEASWSDSLSAFADSLSNGLTSLWDSLTGFLSSAYTTIASYFNFGSEEPVEHTLPTAELPQPVEVADTVVATNPDHTLEHPEDLAQVAAQAGAAQAVEEQAIPETTNP